MPAASEMMTLSEAVGAPVTSTGERNLMVLPLTDGLSEGEPATTMPSAAGVLEISLMLFLSMTEGTVPDVNDTVISCWFLIRVTGTFSDVTSHRATCPAFRDVGNLGSKRLNTVFAIVAVAAASEVSSGVTVTDVVAATGSACVRPRGRGDGDRCLGASLSDGRRAGGGRRANRYRRVEGDRRSGCSGDCRFARIATARHGDRFAEILEPLGRLVNFRRRGVVFDDRQLSTREAQHDFVEVISSGVVAVILQYDTFRRERNRPRGDLTGSSRANRSRDVACRDAGDLRREEGTYHGRHEGGDQEESEESGGCVFHSEHSCSFRTFVSGCFIEKKPRGPFPARAPERLPIGPRIRLPAASWSHRNLLFADFAHCVRCHRNISVLGTSLRMGIGEIDIKPGVVFRLLRLYEVSSRWKIQEMRAGHRWPHTNPLWTPARNCQAVHGPVFANWRASVRARGKRKRRPWRVWGYVKRWVAWKDMTPRRRDYIRVA